MKALQILSDSEAECWYQEHKDDRFTFVDPLSHCYLPMTYEATRVMLTSHRLMCIIIRKGEGAYRVYTFSRFGLIDKLGAVTKAFVFNAPQLYPAGDLLYHCSLVGGYENQAPDLLAIEGCKNAIIRCSVYAESLK